MDQPEVVVRSIALFASITLLASVASCKDKKQDAPATGNPAPITKAPAGSATPPPRLPESAPANVPHEPVTIEEAQGVLPKIEGTQVLALKQTSDSRQVHGTWCIDGVGAGYSGLAVRGDARKAGVSGDRNSFRMSMVVSASGAASCAAPQHYFASATIFRP